MTDKIKQILKVASDIHAGVNQFYDKDKPYSVHLEAVLSNALIYGEDLPDFERYKEVIAFGACFHDTIEDARLTYNDVKKIALDFFDQDDAVVATEIVYALTNEKGRNRAERENDKYFDGIRNTPFAPFVKCCDRLANFKYSINHESKMVKAYYKEMPEFLSRLSGGNGGIPERLINKINDLMTIVCTKFETPRT